MVKLIMGLKGAGKTAQLVQDINEAIKTEAGQELTKNMAMFAFCNGMTSKKAIKKLKDDVLSSAFYCLLKEEKCVRDIFAKCVYEDLRAEA